MSFVLSLIKIIVGVLVAAFAYYYAQKAVDLHRASLSFQSFLECVHKVSAYDWSKVPGGKPGSASEICRN